ncbi:putative transporter C11D3.18C [Diplodia seriata]|uniref:Putative transporter C11D3.18C n=1 Tax=Diplodia seriata TaxID=420778 RepID=A0A1S8BKP5_9PEZI|nr:putative transporter C11D3.18C [Diplodia seriata]
MSIKAPEVVTASSGASTPRDSERLPGLPFDPKIERRILRKLDFQVVPLLCILFLISFIDRSNVANAKIQGMEEDLNLHGNQYNIAVWIFTLAYVVFGVPANLVFKKFGPKTLSLMMLCWGITVIGQGVTRSAGGLIACRFLEGIMEAGFVPGCAYLIGSYYKKDEFLRRYTWFFSAAIAAGAFNGLLATLISKMDGVGNYEGWRWIFIIEGLITVVFSFCSIFWIVPFPEQSTMFTAEEKAVLLTRIVEDGGVVRHDKLGPKRFVKYMLDWKIWLWCVVVPPSPAIHPSIPPLPIPASHPTHPPLPSHPQLTPLLLLRSVLSYLGAEENAASVVAFQPSILRGLGYTATQAQIHSIPIYAASFVFSLTCAYISERIQQRYVFGMLGSIICAAGLAVELAQPRAPNIRYMGMFFVTAGPYLTMPITVVWCAINLGKGYKRTVGFACVIALGNCGAFVASNVFITREAPVYRSGFSTNMGFVALSLVSQTALYVGLRLENRRRERERRALPEVLDEKAYEDAGETHPDFRYQL